VSSPLFPHERLKRRQVSRQHWSDDHFDSLWICRQKLRQPPGHLLRKSLTSRRCGRTARRCGRAGARPSRNVHPRQYIGYHGRVALLRDRALQNALLRDRAQKPRRPHRARQHGHARHNAPPMDLVWRPAVHPASLPPADVPRARDASRETRLRRELHRRVLQQDQSAPRAVLQRLGRA